MNDPGALDGDCGQAFPLEILDTPEYAETVRHYLLTVPGASIAWSQYILAAVRLRDNTPGFPEPHHQFDGSTHELVLYALNPSSGPYDAAKINAFGRAGHGIPMLMPVNLAWQMEGTDQEAAELTTCAARAIVNGRQSPEPPLGYGSFRDTWNVVLIKTLAHLRGEAHAP
jgi:hypothetical protein